MGNPGVEVLSHAVGPQVLDHRRGDEDLPCDWLVGIDLIHGDNHQYES
jgi:hypothetical protein